MKKLIIIKAGKTFPATRQVFGDFEDWVIAASMLPSPAIAVINVVTGEALPHVDETAGVIVTGSHAMVTDHEHWIKTVADWIPQVIDRNIPFLGICFGHQLLAQAMGGQSGYHSQGREIGSVSIALTEDGRHDKLLGYLPAVFFAHTTHAQTVLQLPPNAIRLAENPFEFHHAFRLGSCAWGVQFHPEFSAEIMRSYITEQASTLAEAGYDVQALQQNVCNTPEANSLLERFIRVVQEGQEV
ncbi:MAG: glutamine amidotransferase [Methylovulum sp.]